mgnify:CR=1 FL=1
MRSEIVLGALLLAAATLLALLVRRARSAAARLPPLEVPPAAPREAALLGLEAQLEHAPVALFRIDSGSPDQLAPVNASARRLLAPGRASDVDQLRLTLAGLATGQRRRGSRTSTRAIVRPTT